MKAFDANDLPPSPLEAPQHGGPPAPDLAILDGAGAPKRRDLRDRILLSGAALLAVGALGTSLVALQRDVPFLDVAVERASAQGDIDTPLAATVPTRPPSTTSSSTTAAPATTTTTAPTTTVPEVLAALDSTTTTTAQDEQALDDAGTEADDAAWSDEDDGTPAVAAPGPTAGPTPTVWVPPTPEPTTPTAPPGGGATSTTAPAPTTTAGPTTTTAPAPAVLQVALTCKSNTSGLTLTLTPNGDGTLQKVRVATFPTACKNKPVKAVLLDGGGQTLATLNGQIRNSSPYTLTISGWPPVAVDQIAVVSLVNP